MSRASSVAVVAMLLLVAGCVAGSDVIIEPQDPKLVEVGAELYAVRCAECHGVDLRGTDQGPSHLSIVYEPNHHADGAFLFAIEQGVRAHHWGLGDMPPVEGLTTEDVEAIIAFVRETQRVEGFESY